MSARALAAVVIVVAALALAAASRVDAQASPRRGISRTKAITINQTTPTAITPATGARFRAWSCIAPASGTDGVYVVNSGDTDTTDGRGPFCDSGCSSGAIFGNETSAAYAMSTTGSVALRCEFEVE